jgi:hypothetical protein
MDAAVLGGLAEQWVWRCQMVVTDYQLGRPIDFSGEVEKLVMQAEAQARLLAGDGIVLLIKVEDRLAMSAHMARGRILPPAARRSDSADVLRRADALHAIADAFGNAVRRLKLVEV